MNDNKLSATAVAVIAALGFSGAASAVPQWCIDMGGPPCTGGPGGGEEEEAGNNLSTPGVLTEGTTDVPAFWTPPAQPQLGVHYSYGCDKPEALGQFSYPNTSCVNDLANPTQYLDATACTAPGAPCEGEAVSRIFWQKVATNDWSADADGIAAPRDVAYVNWGDALEAVSWNERSVIRVETQPYSSQIPGFDPTVANCADAASAAGLDPAVACKVGFQMWHVSGQGTTEQWGARAVDDGTNTSHNYDSPFEIINSNTARLNLTKLSADSATCPSPGEGEGGDPPPVPGNWTGSGWEGTCTWYDAPYAVELSVTGKYVYGYNWRMANVELASSCPGWDKTGYWRLTFYSPPISAVNFLDAAAPTTAPPDVPAEVRALPRTAFNDALTPIPPEPPETDALYTPVVDTANNLTYIDICITSKTQGGGGGQGGRP